MEMPVRRLFLGSLGALLVSAAWCAAAEAPSRIIISVKEQKLMLIESGMRLATYPVSTSKFGLGDNWGHMTTPLGFLEVAQKIGDNAPLGAVFHNRRFTGEIIKPNAPGRDPIITRIIWLKGLQPENAHAFSRCIYIHGTPQEHLIGRPASFGCIRMKSVDVTNLYNQIPLGAIVEVVQDSLPKVPNAPKGTVFMPETVKVLSPPNGIYSKSQNAPPEPEPPPQKDAGNHPSRSAAGDA